MNSNFDWPGCVFDYFLNLSRLLLRSSSTSPTPRLCPQDDGAKKRRVKGDGEGTTETGKSSSSKKRSGNADAGESKKRTRK